MLLLFSSCKTLTRKTGSENQIIQQTENGWPDCINCPVTNDSITFRFDTITQAEFEKYKRNYQWNITTAENGIIHTDTSFSIHTSDSTFSFPSDTNNYSQFAYYNGFITPLRLHVVTYIDGHNGVGNLFLVDEKENKVYAVESEFDDPCESPLISPKRNYMVSISNNTFDDNNSFISIIKINKHRKTYTYEGLGNISSLAWKIKELAWMDERSFALRVVTLTRNEATGDAAETEIYLKVSFYKKISGINSAPGTNE